MVKSLTFQTFFCPFLLCWALKVLQDSYVAPPALVQLQLIDTQHSSNGEDSNFACLLKDPRTLDLSNIFIFLSMVEFEICWDPNKNIDNAHMPYLHIIYIRILWIYNIISETNSKKPLKIGRNYPQKEAKDPIFHTNFPHLQLHPSIPVVFFSFPFRTPLVMGPPYASYGLMVQKSQGQPPGMLLKPCNWWDKLSINRCRISEPSTVWFGSPTNTITQFNTYVGKSRHKRLFYWFLLTFASWGRKKKVMYRAYKSTRSLITTSPSFSINSSEVAIAKSCGINCLKGLSKNVGNLHQFQHKTIGWITYSTTCTVV